MPSEPMPVPKAKAKAKAKAKKTNYYKRLDL